MLLIYYRCYITHAFLGLLFQIDDSNVSRNIIPFLKRFVIPNLKKFAMLVTVRIVC